TVKICGYIEAAGDEIFPEAVPSGCAADGGNGDASAVPASASGSVFVATVTTAAGPWQMTAWAEGSLELAEVDGGTGVGDGGTIGFVSNGISTPTVVIVPIVSQPNGGVGVIRTVVGAMAQEFEFNVS